MKEEIEKMMQRAEDCLSDAAYNFKDNRYLVVINRAYYCVFDCLQALLCSKDIFPKTHQGSRIKFNELYVKTSIFPINMSQIVDETFEMRQTADYDFDTQLTAKDAHRAIENATLFLKQVREYFTSLYKISIFE